ncbi:MAG: glycosyltransferase family 4 protein [Bacteroidetes bacterium]|nr:glycosyltransferase family 4 protein [Bacteroidota bacterium]MBL7103233.1 glycosyltransferase family 4 protein [Bacteroidales bacterium]
MKVCHITTVHPEKDVRIFYKECKSLAKHGFEVKLIVINGKSFTEDGVEVIGVPCNYSGRLQRFLKAPKAAYRKALQVDAGIYHFHDPEFLPYANKLKRKGKKVIYDVHEDLPRQILSKYWINKNIRKIISSATERFENSVCKKLDFIITATPFIRNRFININPNVLDINNFPVLDFEKELPDWSCRENKVCYIGSLTKVRGITELVKSLSYIEGVTLELGGTFSPEEYRNEIIKTEGWDRVTEYGFVNRKTADEIMARSVAGMVNLHPIINYIDSLPVKMFEYMEAGVPVIASNFPLWKEIVEDNNCGICIDPFKPDQIARAINSIVENPQQAEEMGRNGLRIVKEKYNWEIEKKKLVSIYTDLI